MDGASNTLRVEQASSEVRLTGEIGAIRAIFDSAYYLRTYPDIAAAGVDPLSHFLSFGGAEGRNPCALFDTTYYRSHSPDIAASGLNPLVHYVCIGARKGFAPSPLFDPEWYLSQAPDTGDAARANPLAHYLHSGWREGRGAHPLFDQAWYLERCPEARADATCPLAHYAEHGARTRHSPHPLFDAAFYLERYPDVAAAGVNPLADYLKRGHLDPLQPHPLFDAEWYLREYADVASAKANPLVHYVVDGIREGRTAAAVRTAARRPAPDRTQSGRHDRRVLVIDWRVPMADVSAGERVTVGILSDLCEIGFEVVFAAHNMEPAPEYEGILHQLGVTVVTRESGYGSPAQYIREQGDSFGLYYLIRVDCAEPVLDTIRHTAPSAIVVFHDPDVHFLRERRQALLNNDLHGLAAAKATEARELAMMQRVDHTIIHSPAEAPLLRSLLPDATPISTLSALYSEVDSDPAPFDQRHGVFFVGGFEHLPNVDGTLWFAAEVWPKVRAHLPDATFHIVGSKMPQSILELGVTPGIQVHGYVKDLSPLLSATRVGVAPLRYGAGIKGKVAAMMGAGMACVCTTIAAEGMGIGDGTHAYIADDAESFAQAVIKAYTDIDVWQRLSSAGQHLATNLYGRDASRASLMSALDAAGALPISLWLEHCNGLEPRALPRTFGKVDVSIIIPVYNHWELTRACLNSILEASAADGVSYEIILADDCSTDETVFAAFQFPGLRIIKTPRNLGFLRNCNNAAKHARGKYLLLLNNDTVVMPGWLAALHRAMQEDRGIAIAGSKFLYPDGVIQEAGAVLWSDGTAHNYGRGQPRRALHCNYPREVDYISGASILIERGFWDEVGGFDERYETAYCEDCDLAITARSRGKQVVYVPASEVIHLEHQSYADQSPAGNATLQRINTARMKEKWDIELKTNHLPSTAAYHLGMAKAQRGRSALGAAARANGQLSILYFSPFPSHPGKHGNQARIRVLGNLLQNMGYKVHFVVLRADDLFSSDDVADMRRCWTTVDVIEKPIAGTSLEFDGWYPQGLGEHIATLCAKYDVDVLLCSYVFHCKLLEFVPEHVLKVIDTHDKMGNRFDMLRANGIPLEFFSCTPEDEGAYLKRADIVLAIQAREADYFRGVSGRPVYVVSHLTSPQFRTTATTGVLKNVGLVASPNQINLGVVRESIAEIDRRVGGGSPPFTFHIAGQVKEMVDRLAPDESYLFYRPWVRMHGFVADIASFYASIDLVISPVMVGTGINVKTVEAMAFGMPLLTTMVGSKGIETGEPMHTHADVGSLTDSLFSLTTRPAELDRLASISRSRYAEFYQEGLEALRSVFSHPKLRAS